jgi:undecaprenyl-phosphate galactose phosphotransferase
MRRIREAVLQKKESRFDASHALHPHSGETSLFPPLQKRKHRSFPLQWFCVSDAIGLSTALALAWGIALSYNGIFLGRYSLFRPFHAYGIAEPIPFLVIIGGCLVGFFSAGHYRMRMPFWLEAKNVTANVTVAIMATCFLLFAVKHDFSRLWLLSDWILSIILILVLRTWVRSYAYKAGRWEIATLLIGNGDTARGTIHALQSEKALGYKIRARIEDLPSAFLQAGRSWQELCRLLGVEYIIIALDSDDMTSARLPLAQLMRESIPFSLSPPLSHLPVTGMTPHYMLNHDVVLFARSHGLYYPVPRLVKRACDIVVSTLGLFVLSPVFITLAMLIKLDGGTVFFNHPRIGRHGTMFSCIKFRSMAVDSDSVLKAHLAACPQARREWERTHKLKHDPRVTRIGAFLRRTSLDELPQLLNVLKGDMSLVGPRPIVAGEITRYSGDIDYYHSVRPGITGLWQVSGRNDVSYEQRVHMDSWYVRNWSLWHDIAILLKTLPALIKCNGAY